MGGCKSKEKAKGSNGAGGAGQANDYRPDPVVRNADMIRKESGMVGGQQPHVMVVNNGPQGIVGSGWSAGTKGINPNSPSIAQNGRGVGGAGGAGALQIVIALYTYQGSEMGDMSFQKGDRMEVLDKT